MKQHFNSKEVKLAAQGHWLEILAAANIDVIHNLHQPCPACGGKDRFRFDDRHNQGGYICGQCGAGDGFSLLMKANSWGFDETLTFVAGVLGFSLAMEVNTIIPTRKNPIKAPPTFTASNPNPYAVKQIAQIKRKVTADNGTIDKYLVSRGLNTGSVSPAYIRLMQACEPESKKTLPCMVCPIRTVDGYVTGYHKTYLDPETGSKAQIANPKRFTPALYDSAYAGCSVHLGKCDGKLLIVEGIETGLAVMQMTGKAVWCSLTASMMKNIIVPSYVRVIEIWADNDANGTGQDAAQTLCDRLTADGKVCRIVMPDIGGDWLDILNQRKVVM